MARNSVIQISVQHTRKPAKIVKITLNNSAGELDTCLMTVNDAEDDAERIATKLGDLLEFEWTRLHDGDSITIEALE